MVVLGTLAGVGTVGLIGGAIIRKAATEVAVSNKRVLVKSGFFSHNSIEVLLPKVESIGVNESIFARKGVENASIERWGMGRLFSRNRLWFFGRDCFDRSFLMERKVRCAGGCKTDWICIFFGWPRDWHCFNRSDYVLRLARVA